MKKRSNDPDWINDSGEELKEALAAIHNFIHQITGQAPSQTEIASALKRYFVLNEIKEHIEMERFEKK